MGDVFVTVLLFCGVDVEEDIIVTSVSIWQSSSWLIRGDTGSKPVFLDLLPLLGFDWPSTGALLLEMMTGRALGNTVGLIIFDLYLPC